MEEIYRERWELARGRLKTIPEELQSQQPFREFFQREAAFLQKILILYEQDPARQPLKTEEELAEENRDLYRELLPDHYSHCWGNPRYAAEQLGEEYGPLFSFLYTELRGTIVYAYEQRTWDLLVSLELFLEIYGMFAGGELPEARHVKKSLYFYCNDYLPEMVEYRTKELVDPALTFAAKIILESDLTDPRYLYRYGEYITENETKTAAHLASLSQEEIDAMARTYTEGYRIGFLAGGKDLSKKRTVNIRYPLGFERMVKAAIGQFAGMGLQPVIYRAAAHAVNKRQHLRIGYSGAVANHQFEFDHKGDAALYMDEAMVSRKLRAQQEAFESMKILANTHAGPACIECFGEEPFVPQECPEALRLNEKQQKLQVEMDAGSQQITNRYIIGEERSFTIIAYPIPAIGEKYEEIFRETVKINTLDYQLYQRIQQCLIDALDQGESVHVLGCRGNRTDFTIRLQKLTDPARQTIFENCVADVNIPVGEVFTTPVLEGTNGTLHVSGVYLGEYFFKDLEMKLEDGIVTEYTCANFAEEEENRRYIEENILFHHEFLPIGEFAIGTNTTAYRMARDYDIAALLPILIAEKTGPHFAFGDTCYSWQEDTPVFNPDGKEIIARDNSFSLLRKTKPEKAYFGCHTDITIPYEELGEIRVQKPDGDSLLLMKDGRFVLPGTEVLNQPLDAPASV